MTWWRQLMAWRRGVTPVEEHVWQDIVTRVLAPYRLNEQELVRLRQLTDDFIRRKAVNGAGGFEIDSFVRGSIGALACLLVLELGVDWYDGWVEIIVYPGPFIVDMEEYDEAGVLHRHREVLGGEAWERGPVILSWEDIDPATRPPDPGYSVAIHEFAHKLDMLSGAADGRPPLHRDMSPRAWHEAMSHAFEHMAANAGSALDGSFDGSFDGYAAQSPAEFFAVMSEVFLGCPERLHQDFPAVYTQLAAFYRQDALRRAAGIR